MENMDNKKPLRTLYAVQMITIIVLLLLVIWHALPFFGINLGGERKFISPGGKGYISPASQTIGATFLAPV